MNASLTVNENAEYFEKTKLQLTLKISLVMGGILSVLGISFIILDQPIFYLSLSGTIICFSLAAVTYYTKKYKSTAFLFSLTGMSMSIYALLAMGESLHFVDPLWMLIVSLFTYFTLGKLMGTLTIICQFAAVAYYLLFNLNENLANLNPLNDGELYSIALNSSLCALVIAYLINQFIKRNAFAANQYRNLTNELQLKNELVESQNSEKTAMLKEIHHRVKNNLQVITSLLRLQSREMTNPESLKHFKEAIDRIGAMALIHNQMYQSKDLNKVQLEPYLHSLSKNIMSSYALNIRVDIRFDIKIEHTQPNTIVPIALLFNELVSNSLEHAFRGKETGEIFVFISANPEGGLNFIYHDNGTWKEPEKTDSFGLELIETLAHQLNGTVYRDTENGTRYEFDLRLNEE